MNDDLHHVYHLYADGSWEEPWEEHIWALHHTGLAKNLTTFSVGLVGSEQNRAAARERVELDGATVVVEEDYGYEQVTLSWLHGTVQDQEGCYYYAHTKGAGYANDLQKPWRRTLEYGCSVHWGECVGALRNGMDCAGVIFLNDVKWNPRPFFAGNFWWARSDFLKNLPPISYATRFEAEVWIGSGRLPSVYATRPEQRFPPSGWDTEWVNQYL